MAGGKAAAKSRTTKLAQLPGEEEVGAVLMQLELSRPRLS